MTTFGIKEAGIEYIFRPAVYSIMFSSQKDKIAIIFGAEGIYFLPGGGLENNETHEECLKREAIEELGVELEIGKYLGCAQRYFYSSQENRHYLNQGYFYFCKMGKKICNPIEEDHLLQWVEPNEAAKLLFHEHQSWAVNEAVKRIET